MSGWKSVGGKKRSAIHQSVNALSFNTPSNVSLDTLVVKHLTIPENGSVEYRLQAIQLAYPFVLGFYQRVS